MNLLEPGDTAIVGVHRLLRRRIAEMAERCGAKVVEVSADWGEHVPNEQLLDALDQHPDARLARRRPRRDLDRRASIPLEELGRELSAAGATRC